MFSVLDSGPTNSQFCCCRHSVTCRRLRLLSSPVCQLCSVRWRGLSLWQRLQRKRPTNCVCACCCSCRVEPVVNVSSTRFCKMQVLANTLQTNQLAASTRQTHTFDPSRQGNLISLECQGSMLRSMCFWKAGCLVSSLGTLDVVSGVKRLEKEAPC